jgi:hypothetical protein
VLVAVVDNGKMAVEVDEFSKKAAIGAAAANAHFVRTSVDHVGFQQRLVLAEVDDGPSFQHAMMVI